MLSVSLNKTFLSYFQVGSVLFKVTDDELNLREEVSELKREQEAVSVTEEFAQHTKLQRKIDKLVADIKHYGQHFSFLLLGWYIYS